MEGGDGKLAEKCSRIKTERKERALRMAFMVGWDLGWLNHDAHLYKISEPIVTPYENKFAVKAIDKDKKKLHFDSVNKDTGSISLCAPRCSKSNMARTVFVC